MAHGNVFGENGKCRDRVRFVKDVSKDMHQAYASSTMGNQEVVRMTRQIAWVPPSGDWVKLNTDGASHGNPGLATAGGILRDGEGTWI